MPAVEAIRSFARARVCVVALLTLAAAACSDPTGPGDSFSDSPALSLSPTPVTMMASASEHACVLRATGAIECWGDDTYGEAPQYREAIGGWYTHLDVSDEHSCAVRNDGIVECWGRQTTPNKAPSTVIAAVGQFVRVAAGGDHSCAVRTDGNIQCWGKNNDGQAPATRAPSASSFVRVTTGLFHTCGLRADGIAECWGFNVGQAPVSRAPRNGSPYISISSNTGHTCAARTDGVVECWGQNEYGQADTIRTPTASSFTQVSAGLTHTCAVRADGIVECWGRNDHGEAPASWSATSGQFGHVAAGNFFSCGSRTGGNVECLGTHTAPVPSRPASLSGVVTGPDVQLTWPNDAVETSYRIERRVRPTTTWGAWSVLANTPAPDVTAFTDTSVVVGPRYQYRISACAAGGCSQPGDSVEFTVRASAPPARLLTVGTIRLGGALIDVVWTDTLSTEARYEIVRQSYNDSTGAYFGGVRIGSAPMDATSFRDSTATRGLQYRYRVRACNARGCSSYLDTRRVLAETAGTIVSSVTTSALSATSIRVVWPASHASWYVVSRRQYNGGAWGAYSVRGNHTASGSSEAYVDTASPNTRYQYRVRACTVVGCSAWREAAAVRTPTS